MKSWESLFDLILLAMFFVFFPSTFKDNEVGIATGYELNDR
jgi:hypothetical protein